MTRIQCPSETVPEMEPPSDPDAVPEALCEALGCNSRATRLQDCGIDDVWFCEDHSGPEPDPEAEAERERSVAEQRLMLKGLW